MKPKKSKIDICPFPESYPHKAFEKLILTASASMPGVGKIGDVITTCLSLS